MRAHFTASLLFAFAITGCGQKTEAPKVAVSGPAATAAAPTQDSSSATQLAVPQHINNVVSTGEFPQAFALEGGHSLEGYQGLDPFKFLTMYSSKLNIAKGEFETTTDFQKRKSNTEALLAPILSKALYAFQLGNFSVKYDADTKSYASDYSCRVPYGQPMLICLLKVGDTQDAKYMAQNGYGAKVEVSQTSGIFMNLAIKDKNPLFKSNPKWASDVRFIDLKMPVSVDSVQSMRGDKLSMIVIGNVGGTGVLTDGSAYKEPTREDPREISFAVKSIPFTLKKVIFYNETTGEILVEKSF